MPKEDQTFYKIDINLNTDQVVGEVLPDLEM